MLAKSSNAATTTMTPIPNATFPVASDRETRIAMTPKQTMIPLVPVTEHKSLACEPRRQWDWWRPTEGEPAPKSIDGVDTDEGGNEIPNNETHICQELVSSVGDTCICDDERKKIQDHVGSDDLIEDVGESSKNEAMAIWSCSSKSRQYMGHVKT